MGSSAGFFVRLEPADEAKLRVHLKSYQELVFEEGFPFAQVANDAEPNRELLCAISKELETDVIWLEFESTVDAFRYLHWRRGALVRTLRNGLKREGTWESVDGEPEPWERWKAPPKLGAFDPISAREAALLIAEHWGFAGTGAEPRTAKAAKPKPGKPKPAAKEPAARRKPR